MDGVLHDIIGNTWRESSLFYKWKEEDPDCKFPRLESGAGVGWKAGK